MLTYAYALGGAEDEGGGEGRRIAESVSALLERQTLANEGGEP